jgi:pimeloyl-ACP methyl ester carboxylesterase
MTNATNDFREIAFTARDGLQLYGRHYAAKSPGHRRPVLCLAGLTRNSRDFGDIARALSTHPQFSRDVYTIDMRGRGLSGHDRDWRNYAVPVEMQDVIDFMAMTELHDAGIIGTSRGGLITLVLAAAQPSRIGAVVLNDIGPVIEQDGLVRIAGYVGRFPLPKSWSDAARALKSATFRDFPNLSDADAEALARQIFNERDGRPTQGYDPKLSKCLSVLDGPMPALWPQFEGLKRVPLLVIRGENSDLLSAATVEEMRRRHPMMASLTVKGEGHAPLLKDAEATGTITKFFAETDAIRHGLSAAAQ